MSDGAKHNDIIMSNCLSMNVISVIESHARFELNASYYLIYSKHISMTYSVHMHCVYMWMKEIKYFGDNLINVYR